MEKFKGEKEIFTSLQSLGSGTGFGSETSMPNNSGGFGGGSGFGGLPEVEFFSSKPGNVCLLPLGKLLTCPGPFLFNCWKCY